MRVLLVIWSPYFKRVDLVSDVEACEVGVAERVFWDGVELEAGRADGRGGSVWVGIQRMDGESV
jgi:hypothetical protein